MQICKAMGTCEPEEGVRGCCGSAAAVRVIRTDKESLLMDGDNLPSGIGSGGRVTLRDIAEAVGISVSTASRALSGAPGISEAMRSRVQSAAERLNYAGSSVSLSSVTVFFDMNLAESGAGEFMHAVQRGIERRARELGIALSMQLMGPSAIARLEPDRETAGYLLLSMQPEELLQQLSERGIPAVIVNGRDPLMRLDAVAPANRTGGYLAARHLLQLGHRRILTLGHSPRPTIRDRMGGNVRAMQEAGVEPDAELVIELEAMRTNLAYRAIKRRIERAKRADFTAVLCCNDSCAFGAIAALTEVGLSVPGDVSVVGFDDIQQMAFVNPSLTTVHLPLYEVGARSCERLVERVRGRVDRVAETLPTHLVLRGSTGIVPAHRAS